MTARPPGRIAAAVAMLVMLASARLPWMAGPEMADAFGHLPRGPARILKATTWSLQGLRAAWLYESSFRLEVYLFVILGPLGWWLGANGIERALLIGSMLLVLSIELLNSAVEAVIERYGPEHHELAGRAKDMGSAAVFVMMMNVVLCWGLILVPRWT
jgi:diacylglycerol kinase (ATP)